MLLPTAAFPVCSHDVLRIWLAWLRLVIPLLISGWHHNIGLQVSYPRQVLGKSFLVTRKLHEKPHRRICACTYMCRASMMPTANCSGHASCFSMARTLTCVDCKRSCADDRSACRLKSCFFRTGTGARSRVSPFNASATCTPHAVLNQ